MISNTNKFNILIEEIKQLHASNIPNREITKHLFYSFIGNIRPLKKDDSINSDLRERNLNFLMVDLKNLKESILIKRRDETKEIIKDNSEWFRYSSFELMEHDFRENTHSNILKYIFDYGNTGNYGIHSLCKLIRDIDSNSSIIQNIIKKQYKILREFNVGNGRIDILIIDSINKFVIVVENKVLADIAEKEFDLEKNVSRTQLDNYFQYFKNNEIFNSYEKLFILLSYKNFEGFDNTYFKYLNYKSLYNCLIVENTDDSIVKDYLILLKKLLNNNIDKSWLIEISKSVLTNSMNLNLKDLETINTFVK